jgi:hypothetical protein
MEDPFKLLLERGLTTSQRDFSTYWLGRSPSYLATVGHLSDAAMIALCRKLIEEQRWWLAIRVAHMILFGRRQHDDEVAA